ncbi:MAG: PSD1 and planctomycete cytochrome C domain-containing protein [Planctomycetota bacterium]
MLRHHQLLSWLLPLLVCCCADCGVFAAEARVDPADAGDAPPEWATEGEKLFALHINPILQEKCFGCHGPDIDEPEGGFVIADRESMLMGGDAFGESVVALGDHSSSEIMEMLSREFEGMEMPPKESESLTAEQVTLFGEWIDAGAPWPSPDRVAEIYDRYAGGVTHPTRGGLSEEWTRRKYEPKDLWAFMPMRDELESLGRDASSVIDDLLMEQIDASEISPADIADRRTLIRRLSFDLHGLPPTPAEVDAFVNDSADDETAWASLVDRLLASPQYGVQWGRHWLDVVRYADSGGFANDWERPNAWRYRDYVIRSLNDDKSYDQFMTEQLAGDELVDMTNQDLTPSQTSEYLIAAGFLRMGPWEQTVMSVPKVTRQAFLDDVTDTVGQVFMAQPMQCCRCHDHKFDPIPTVDYYSMQAVFATTQFAERDAAWLPSENLSGMEDDHRLLERTRKNNNERSKQAKKAKNDAYAKWFADRGLPHKSIQEAKKAGLKAEELPPTDVISPDQYGLDRITGKWRARFTWEMDRYKPIAYSVYSGAKRSFNQIQTRIDMPQKPMKGEIEQTTILSGGDVFAASTPVTPAVLSAVEGAMSFDVPTSPQGRRSAFAQWLLTPEHPLTSRVMVNRVWSGHFGNGIAGNPNNFGATGKKPTHPRLLDYLARWFIDDGWSIKRLHRAILMTQAYRRSSNLTTEDSDELETARRLYAVRVPRRLAAEEIRDSALRVSGELVATLGGVPAKPDMNLEAALQPRLIMGTFAPSYVPHAKPERRNRRSIFVQRTRGLREPVMEVFNQPGFETSCELRDTSNVTPQVFALLNGQESIDRAVAFADRVVRETGSDAEAIDRMFQLAFARKATVSEHRVALEHWRVMTERHQEAEIASANPPIEVIREAVEETTGKLFSFTEPLFAYEDYQPDKQLAEVDERTRGLADVALVLLNANEFMYVY